jgi:hypothetical protein
MARRVECSVLTLRCRRCAAEFPHVVFSGDTDMATNGLCSLTAVGVDEVVIGELNGDEWKLGFTGAVAAFKARVSAALARGDLRDVPLVGTEAESGEPNCTRSFVIFRRLYAKPRALYGCAVCDEGEAIEVAPMEPGAFSRGGGKLTVIGDLTLL